MISENIVVIIPYAKSNHNESNEKKKLSVMVIPEQEKMFKRKMKS